MYTDVHVGRLGRRAGRADERYAAGLQRHEDRNKTERRLRQLRSGDRLPGHLPGHDVPRHHQHVHRRHPRKLQPGRPPAVRPKQRSQLPKGITNCATADVPLSASSAPPMITVSLSFEHPLQSRA